jgi:hypothetical protein
MCDTELDLDLEVVPDQDEQVTDGQERPADGPHAGVAWG